MRCGAHRPWVADAKSINSDRKNVSHNTKEVKIKSERKKIKNFTCKSRYKKVALIKFLFLVYHKVNFLINCSLLTTKEIIIRKILFAKEG